MYCRVYWGSVIGAIVEMDVLWLYISRSFPLLRNQCCGFCMDESLPVPDAGNRVAPATTSSTQTNCLRRYMLLPDHAPSSDNFSAPYKTFIIVELRNSEE